ncbi:VWA domain-containing protein [Streptomyces sp. NPDC007940]|uniref:VWA domain-containing protein n=1 Tax=Streptomyces sp. NPDC007940 TaxID=3364796 RepID=UPI0036EBEAE4
MGILTLLRNAFGGRSRKGAATEAEGAETTPSQETAPKLPSPAPEPAPVTATVPEPRTSSGLTDSEHELVAAAFDNVAVPKQSPPAEDTGAAEQAPVAEEAPDQEKDVAESAVAEEKPSVTEEAAPEGEPTPVVEPEPKVEAAAETAPEPEPTVEPEPEPEPVSVEEPQPVAAEAAPEAEDVTEAAPEAEPVAEVTPEPEPTVVEPEPEPEPEPEAAAQPEAEPATAEAAEPVTETAPEPTAEEPEPETAAQPEPEPATAEAAEPVTETAPQPEPAAEVAPEPEPVAETAPEPQPEPTAEEPEPQPEPQPETAAQPEPVAAAAGGEDAPQVAPAADETAGGNDEPAEGRSVTVPASLRTAYDAAATTLSAHDLTGTTAKTYLVLDRSASMRPYYKDGSAQALGEQTLALAAHLDPESTVHVVFFSTELDGTGELTLTDHENKIDDLHAGLGRMGRTSYHAAVEEVLAHHTKNAPDVPALVVFQTDGAPDAKTPATQALTEAAKTHPAVFFSFVAFGDPENKAFDYLRKLKLPNTSHFLAGETPKELTDTEIYQGILANWRP